MTRTDPDRVEVVPCPRNPQLFRWRILCNGAPLDLTGYAYATAWSAAEAGRVALHWHRTLRPQRTGTESRAQDAA